MKSRIKKIGRKFGRRAHDRFSIPGASVSWTGMDPSASPDETLPMSDISRFGVSFLTNNPPPVSSDVSLRIHLPNQSEHFVLAGRIVYVIPRGPGLTYEYRVGVELKPFSQNEGCNPPPLQEKIEEMERRYGKRLNSNEFNIED